MKIKFRAWLKARKIMCEVDSIHFDMDIVLITYPLCGTLTQSMHVDFDDVILMQYIETKDDNDVEICEGDTLKYSTYDGVCI